MKYLVNRFSLFENVQAARQLLNNLKINLDNPDYLKIREMLRNQDGYVHWFCKQHFVNKVDLSELKNIIDAINQNRTIIQSFSKNIIELENIEEFWDQFNAKSFKRDAKLVYDQFHIRKHFLICLMRMIFKY